MLSPGTPGGVHITSESQLWGAELNGLVNLSGGGSFSLDLLAGFRYLDLDENLKLAYGAEVEVNGKLVGTLPLPGGLRVNAGTVNVVVRAAGHRPAEAGAL